MESRTPQYVAAALAAVFVVLVGGVVFVLLSQPNEGPSPSATPTSVALVSPSPTLTPLPSATLLPSPTPEITPEITPETTPEITPEITPEVTPAITPEVTPEITPEITPEPTPIPTDTPVPTPAPTPTPPRTPKPTTSPLREIRITSMGLDPRAIESGGLERKLLFTVDGPSVIRATTSNASGTVRLCIWQGNNAQNQRCTPQGFRNGTFQEIVVADGSTNWTLTAISASQTAQRVTDVTIEFNANAPTVQFRDFRWQGDPNPNYNGITAAIDPTPGDLAVAGEFDPGAQHDWRASVSEAGVGSVIFEEGGPDNSFGPFTHNVTAETTYLITLSNPGEDEEPLPVFVHGSIAWH